MNYPTHLKKLMNNNLSNIANRDINEHYSNVEAWNYNQWKNQPSISYQIFEGFVTI